LGSLSSRHQVLDVLVAIRDLDPGDLEALLDRSRDLGIRLRRMRFSIDDVHARAAILRREL
jgi:hypothetical protein